MPSLDPPASKTPPSWIAKGDRYYSFGAYLRETFPFRVFKIGLDAGFTCPNRDGTVAVGGCTFCNNASFSEFVGRTPGRPLARQVEEGKAFYRARFGAEQYLLYFQAFTNTYAPPERLRAVYDTALAAGGESIVGMSIGTRPDCVPDDVLDLLAEYSERFLIWVEYGIQTKNPVSLDRMNRGHHWEEFEDAIVRTRRRAPKLRICGHIILGCPGDAEAEMRDTVRSMAALGVDGAKIHHLYVAPDTVMAREYAEGKISVLSIDDYVRLAADALEEMPATCVIQRLVGDLAPPAAIAPVWGLSKQQIYTRITGELARRGTRQGSRRET